MAGAKPDLPCSPAAIHPQTHTVAWAAGRFLFALNLERGEWEVKRDDSCEQPIRSLEFGSSSWLVGDDAKCVSMRRAGNWETVGKWRLRKKVTSALFAGEQTFLVADKFGEVRQFETKQTQAESGETGEGGGGDAEEKEGGGEEEDEEEGEGEGKIVIGHLASIITAMIFSSDRRFVITGDKDEKIRVSAWPQCFDIQTFCLGHSEFVTSLLQPEGLPQILVSAAADKTVRLWNLETGICLQTVKLEHIPFKLLWIPSEGGGQEGHVICLCEGLSGFVLMAFTQDGGQPAAASAAGETGAQLGTPKEFKLPLQPLSVVAFKKSPRGLKGLKAFNEADQRDASVLSDEPVWVCLFVDTDGRLSLPVCPLTGEKILEGEGEWMGSDIGESIPLAPVSFWRWRGLEGGEGAGGEDDRHKRKKMKPRQ
uniref:Uncharacterized protein n=1 Tax=Chromera velia CCMP2878 TaxID=1169474 RepID=A0A0G4FEL1_9ALVE|eukprot:Cvel_16542.t1-p1 / transcript=Cvel_16542.t1 / gene=Cvel_16542 / organism=Chromera_velia_CCMP2878 / gene_product=tRNA (guanine-N(7)-)-methyltransferase subunit WDR4, putative / transcript_product=tRNA (guanine-N(7)-)-methyltransferase subunit WDR4, putative / location=Cvel_scaffold1278:39205-42833(-) / protein_length=423 / sequence_SO=supercontig / SO=protein_coding / is_pseudo=false